MAESVEKAEGVEGMIEEVLAGRVEAYAGIVRGHQEEVWRIAAFALRDVAATEDLVQQVFVDAYLALGSYDPARDFGAWLRTIARNLVRKEIRRRTREARKLRAYHEHLVGAWGRQPEEEEKVRAEEARVGDMREALTRCREKLSGDAARAVEGRYERSMGFAEIAQALGRTVAATRQLLQRARLSLRRCIEERTAGS